MNKFLLLPVLLLASSLAHSGPNKKEPGTYGMRHPEVMQRVFEQKLATLNKTRSERIKMRWERVGFTQSTIRDLLTMTASGSFHDRIKATILSAARGEYVKDSEVYYLLGILEKYKNLEHRPRITYDPTQLPARRLQDISNAELPENETTLDDWLYVAANDPDPEVQAIAYFRAARSAPFVSYAAKYSPRVKRLVSALRHDTKTLDQLLLWEFADWQTLSWQDSKEINSQEKEQLSAVARAIRLDRDAKEQIGLTWRQIAAQEFPHYLAEPFRLPEDHPLISVLDGIDFKKNTAAGNRLNVLYELMRRRNSGSGDVSENAFSLVIHLLDYLASKEPGPIGGFGLY